MNLTDQWITDLLEIVPRDQCIEIIISLSQECEQEHQEIIKLLWVAAGYGA